MTPEERRAIQDRIEQAIAVIRFISPKCADDVAHDYRTCTATFIGRVQNKYFTRDAGPADWQIALEVATEYRDLLLEATNA